MKATGNWLTVIGILGIIVAVMWSLGSYGDLSCLATTSGPCLFMQLGGASYSPFIFWLSFIFFVAGVAIKLINLAPSIETNSATYEVHKSTSLQTQTYDQKKWNSLIEYDPDVAAAATAVRPLGEKWVNELAVTFLTLNDKSYLPTIVAQLQKKAADRNVGATEGQFLGYRWKMFNDGETEAYSKDRHMSFKSFAEFERFIRIAGPAS